MSGSTTFNPANSTSTPVRIFTLGRFLIEVQGQPIRFKTKARRKPLELLKALIALGGDSVPIEALGESLLAGVRRGSRPERPYDHAGPLARSNWQ